MLGHLAKMLRLLGYDTLYSPNVTTAELREIAGRDERVVLTRGAIEKRFSRVVNAFRVESEHAPEQLREVVGRFSLDTRLHAVQRDDRAGGQSCHSRSSSAQGVPDP
jgi:uncharacterized protein